MSEFGRSRIEVRFTGETVWLSLVQMSDLFQRDKSVISRHITNIFQGGELRRDSVVAIFATSAADGKTYQVDDVGHVRTRLQARGRFPPV